jgi:two-component system NarL family response regulator
MTGTVTLLLIEHQPLVRIGIGAILAAEPDIEVIAEAVTAAEGFTLFTALRPDVTILSLHMPDSCAIDDLEDYFEKDPKARLIVLAERAGDAEISKALKRGVLGYITQDLQPEELVAAIRSVAGGRKYIPANIAGVLSENFGQDDLTPTETNVLRMIVGGMSNKEIAFALDISENTVKSHVQRIFGKIGVSDRTSAATTAIRRGLVRVDP